MRHMNEPAAPIPLAAAASAAMQLAYAVFTLGDSTIYRLGREDGLFEDLTAACFLLAGGLFLYCFWQVRAGDDPLPPRTGRNVIFLLLGLLLIFGCGEEISWGQRIFGWETPAALAEANVQGELNLHNLDLFHRVDNQGNVKSGLREMLTVERMFSLFWLGFCVFVPALHLAWPRFAQWMRRIRMPIVPLTIGLLFPLNYLIAEMLKPHALSRDLDWPLMEIKEFLFSFLFLIIALCFAQAAPPRPAPAAAPAEELDDPFEDAPIGT